MDSYKAAAYNVRIAVKEAKRDYGKKAELQFKEDNPRSMWQGLRTMIDYKGPPTSLLSADAFLADELNNFYALFEAIGSQQKLLSRACWMEGGTFHTYHPF